MTDVTRIRREPPPFLTATVAKSERITGWLQRVSLEGDALRGMSVADPAASVRVLLPGRDGLALPTWRGNEFLLPDDTRPVIRTLTPRYQRASAVDVDVVLHESGAASDWARSAAVGDEVAISGPGRGSAPDPDGTHLLVVGDESAVPAIAQLLQLLPDRVQIDVVIETGHPDDPAPLRERSDASVELVVPVPDAAPGTALVDAVRRSELRTDTRVWAAGEAASMQQIRLYLRSEDLPRSQATVRGYWKHGKVAGGVS